MNDQEQIEAIKNEAKAAADGGKGPEACKYRPGSDAERTWKDAFYFHYSLRPMTFAVRTLEAAATYKPQINHHMDRSITSVADIKKEILRIITVQPTTSEDIGREIGYQRGTVNNYLRALVADGKIKRERGSAMRQPATYRLAES